MLDILCLKVQTETLSEEQIEFFNIAKYETRKATPKMKKVRKNFERFGYKIFQRRNRPN